MKIRQSVVVVSEPLYEPVSLTEAKRWLRIEDDDTDHDTVVTQLIKAIRRRAENLTQRAFMPRTLCLYLSSYTNVRGYGPGFELPHAPLISVESIKYRDSEDGTLTTLAEDQYDVHSHLEPALILPAWEATWPSIRYVPDAIQITHIAGYAPGSPADEQGYRDSMPEQLKLWMQTNIATLFEHREQIIVGTIVSELQRSYGDGLLDDLVLGSRLF